MLRRLEAKNFRCLRDLSVGLDGDFHLLVGPNGAGKSAFIDVLAFLRDFISDGLDEAVGKRTDNLQDLVWGRPRSGLTFELAVEFGLPDEILEPGGAEGMRYRYEIGIQGQDGAEVAFERGALVPNDSSPEGRTEDERLDFRRTRDRVQYASPTGPQTLELTKREPHLRYGRQGNRSALEALAWWPGTAAREHAVELIEATGMLQLEGRGISQPCPPDRRRRLRMMAQDGANLPWLVRTLLRADRALYDAWLAHVRTALAELKDIRVVEKADDRHAYLMIRFHNDVEVPSWSVSEGTLRMLALTLIAYLPEAPRIYLLEEPENGIHPLAVETVYQSLSSVYDAHVFVATHSPTLLRCADLGQILCFSKTDTDGTRVIPGKQHPRLRNWRGAIDTPLLFASDVLT